jgi:putative endonuclease
MKRDAPRPDHALGAAGEAAAARWLIRRGWRVLATGWRGAGGEIDIVAERRGVVAACEVKTRTRHDPLAPPVRPAQRRRLERAAVAWVARHPAYARHALRPDLIVVEPRGPAWHITRIEGIGLDDAPWH